MAKRIDLSGKKFGKLRVIGFSHTHAKSRLSFWLCECECGNAKSIVGTSLTSGASKSCGCQIAAAAKKRLTKHGRSHDKLHYIWTGMKQRCGNPRNKMFRHYGGRGISVCQEWQEFEGFLKDMGDSWEEGLSIERIDNNQGYCKGNCKWVPRSDQAKNRRPSFEWKFKRNGEGSSDDRSLPSEEPSC